MFSRIGYTFRETFASFQRNLTLTVAAIITSAVSLLIFGLTLLIQQGFDNLLQRWEGGVEMIVFVNAGTAEDGLELEHVAAFHTDRNGELWVAGAGVYRFDGSRFARVH